MEIELARGNPRGRDLRQPALLGNARRTVAADGRAALAAPEVPDLALMPVAERVDGWDCLRGEEVDDGLLSSLQLALQVGTHRVASAVRLNVVRKLLVRRGAKERDLARVPT